MLNCIIH